MKIDNDFNKIYESLEQVKEVDVIKYTELLIEMKKVKTMESIYYQLKNIDNTLMEKL